ncbi:MAG: hypothetical protein KDD82_01610 [Planctomycetes bacterium]|nr:hypothetical protein [Planctomycetota bacterium]
MSEQRRINTGLYGLISLDEHGVQVVSNWPRGTILEIDSEGGKPVVRAAGKVYRLSSGDAYRVRRASSRCR